MSTTMSTSSDASCWCHACNATRKVQMVNEEVQCSDCHSTFVELQPPQSQGGQPAQPLPQTYDTLLGGDATGASLSDASATQAQASPTNIQIPPLTRQPSSETHFIPFSITVQSYSYSPMGNMQLHRSTSQPDQQGADAYGMLQQLMGGFFGGNTDAEQQQRQTAPGATPAEASQQQSQQSAQQPQQQQQQHHQQRPQFFPGLHPFLQMLAMSPMPMMFSMPGHFHHHHAAPPTASKAAVEALEKLTICKQQVDEETQCSVCLTEFEENDDALRMPCGSGKHIYHPQCLLEWLKKSNRCPTCRHELPTDDAHYNAMLEQQRQQQHTATPSNVNAQSTH